MNKYGNITIADIHDIIVKEQSHILTNTLNNLYKLQTTHL